MLVFGAVALSWFLVIGLDRRWHNPYMPIVWQALGLVLLLASTGFILWVMRENSFAAPVVKVQSEHGHRLIDTGPYAWVRHPM
jgi:protein-S-isoprenylcysteine O-methyltransferase Ste14